MESRKIRRVMVGTPAQDDTVNYRYVDSIVPTIEFGAKLNIQIAPVFIGANALVQQSRNDLFQIAYELKVDDLVFIDSDIGWNAQDFIRLLNHNVHIVGGTYRRKTDNEESYVARKKDNETKLFIGEDGLIEMAGLGMGFCRFDNYAINKLWDNTKKYIENKKEKRMIFNVTCENDNFISEDISLCNLWTSLDEKIYLDSKITCSHSGMKCFTGNFIDWINRINIANEEIEASKNKAE